ncbi:MAG: type II secretion system protein [Planctomycetota bacterium]|jgi:prepilin-type N-terminal cleavage/methylation domain-containing protein
MHRTSPTRAASRQGGFTLVEILVVITIIAALISIVAAVIPRAAEANRRTQCANNLKNIGAMLVERSTAKGLGSRGGSAMLLQTYKLGMIRKGDEKVFLCPGDPRDQVIDEPDFKARYGRLDLDSVDAQIISYAGRNRKRFQIRKDLAEKQAWAVDCQGEDGRQGHHQNGLNCLYDDASVVFLDREALDIGTEEEIIIGDESSHDLLKQFVVHED